MVARLQGMVEVLSDRKKKKCRKKLIYIYIYTYIYIERERERGGREEGDREKEKEKGRVRKRNKGRKGRCRTVAAHFGQIKSFVDNIKNQNGRRIHSDHSIILSLSLSLPLSLSIYLSIYMSFYGQKFPLACKVLLSSVVKPHRPSRLGS